MVSPPAEGRNDRPAPTTDAVPRWSVRAFLGWLVLACLVPGLAGAVILFASQYRSGQAQLEKNTIQTARALAQAVDSHLLKAQVLLDTLATDESLARGDLERFRLRAQEALDRTRIGVTIGLVDETGQQILNLLQKPGQPLPRHPDPEAVRLAFAGRQPVVSDVYVGPIAKRPLVSIIMPLASEGRAAHALTVGIPAEHFSGLLLAQDFPPDWVGTLMDRKGAVIARTRAHEQYVGRPGPQDLLEHSRLSPEGSLGITALDGVPIRSFYSRSSLADWTISIGIPRRDLDADLNRAIVTLALGVIGLFGIGLGLAWFLGERIVRSVKALADPATVRGSAGGQPRFHIREVAEAAGLLRQGSRALEEANRSLRARERDLLEAHRIGRFGHWHRDIRTGEIRISESMQELVGRPQLPPYPEQRGTFLTEESWDRVSAAVQETLRTGISYDLELEAFHGNGSRIWINAKGEPVRDDSGEIVALRGTAQDITERKRAEIALRESEGRFRATFEQAAVGIAHLAPDGRWLRVNDRFCAIVGYGREDLLNLSFQDITYPPDLDGQMALHRQLLAGEIPSYALEKRYVRLGGSTVWVHITVAQVRTPSGDPDYSIAVIEDIQRRKETEAALASNQRLLAERSAVLEATNKELQAANRQLEGFVYAASHDLKGPLGRMSNFSSLLERNYRDRLDGDGLRLLDFIRGNALRLTTLIDDLLTHAQVVQQAGFLQPVDVLHAVQAALEEKTEDIRTKGALIRLHLPSAQVQANPFALHQVLTHLLDNALTYTDGAVEPLIDIGGEWVDGRFRLWMQDNGIGFDMAYHDRIFETFRRLHTYDDYAGSGIGLALVKQAMERMGGKVWAESIPGQGAAFFLEFRRADRAGV